MNKFTLLTPNDWWNPVGESAWARIDTKKNELRIYTGKRNRHSAVLRIRPTRFRQNRYDLHYTIFFEDKEQADVTVSISRNQLAVLANIPGYELIPSERQRFRRGAQKYGADLWVIGRFIRAGKKVSVPSPGRNVPGEPIVSFKLIPYIVDKIALLVRYQSVVKPLYAR